MFVFRTKGKLLHSFKSIAHARVCLSHCCQVDIMMKFARGFTRFLKVSRREPLDEIPCN